MKSGQDPSRPFPSRLPRAGHRGALVGSPLVAWPAFRKEPPEFPRARFGASSGRRGGPRPAAGCGSRQSGSSWCCADPWLERYGPVRRRFKRPSRCSWRRRPTGHRDQGLRVETPGLSIASQLSSRCGMNAHLLRNAAVRAPTISANAGGIRTASRRETTRALPACLRLAPVGVPRRPAEGLSPTVAHAARRRSGATAEW